MERKINIGDYILESGELLDNVEIAFTTYGKINEAKDNVIWVCHALTANSDVFEWWQGLFGEKDMFNPNEHFIVCANILGSPYGTTCPVSLKGSKGEKYFKNFPLFTIRDIVGLHIKLADFLKIKNIEVLIGGSLGGHQTLEWSIIQPKRIKNLIAIATSAVHSPWGLAFNESQRLAIETDETYHTNTIDGGSKGLKTARSIALLSYRTPVIYNLTQHENGTQLFPTKANSYQNYQGEKLVKRFDAYSYWYLTKAMDSQNVGRERGGIAAALKLIKANTLVISIAEDLLFPPEDQLVIAKSIPNSKLEIVNSNYGHDGFLIETEKLTKLITAFLKATSNVKNQIYSYTS